MKLQKIYRKRRRECGSRSEINNHYRKEQKKKHDEIIANIPCAICNKYGKTLFHHPDNHPDKGKRMNRISDYKKVCSTETFLKYLETLIPMCSRHHHHLDNELRSTHGYEPLSWGSL